MKLNKYLLALVVFTVFSCGPSEEEEETLTATINGEEWEFYDVTVIREEDGMEIQGMGYLEGDLGAVPVNMRINVVGVPMNGEIPTPYTAYFEPNTQENAAIAKVKPTDEELVFDSELDPNAGGVFEITESTDSVISGEFKFVALDKTGRKLVVENGRFNNLRL